MLRELTLRLARQSATTAMNWLVANAGSTPWALQPYTDAFASQLAWCFKMCTAFKECFGPLFVKYEGIFTADKRPVKEAATTADPSTKDGEDVSVRLGTKICNAALQSLSNFSAWLKRIRSVMVARQQFGALAVSLPGVAQARDIDEISQRADLLSTWLELDTVSQFTWQEGGSLESLGQQADSVIAQLEHTTAKLVQKLLEGDASVSSKSGLAPRTSTQLLRSIDRFHPVGKRKAMESILDFAAHHIFQTFEIELQDVQEAYELGRAEAPLERNSPRVAGSVLWSRNLLRRIQVPMEKFKAYPKVLSNGAAAQTVKTYNKVATALVKFESLWLAKWRAGAKNAKSSLAATLLVYDDETGEVCLNYDPFFASILDESNWLQRLGVKMPADVRGILGEQAKIKQFCDHLKDFLNDRKRVISKVPGHLQFLLTFHLGMLDLALEPGLKSLTWQAPDIDAYLFNVNTKLARLDGKVGELNTELDARVLHITEQFASLKLFDLAWPVIDGVKDEITLVTFLAIQEQCTSAAVQQVMGSLQEIDTAIKNTVKGVETLIVAEASDDAMVNECWATLEQGRNVIVDYCTVRFREALAICVARSMEEIQSFVNGETENYIVLDVEYGLPQHTLAPSLLDAQAGFGKLGSELASWYSSAGASAQKMLDSSMELDQQIAEDHTLAIGEAVVTFEARVADAMADVKTGLEMLSDSCTQLIKRTMDIPMSNTRGALPDLDKCRDVLYSCMGDETRIKSMELFSNIGPFKLQAKALQHALLAETYKEKNNFACQLRESAKSSLQHITEYVEGTHEKLKTTVDTLEQLASVIAILRDLGEFSIDLDTIAVEDMYEILLGAGVNLARTETESISKLRAKCDRLTSFATARKQELTIEKRKRFERLLDTEVKAFMVATIHLRNTFDLSGPKADGITGYEASQRLRRLEKLFAELEAQCEILESIEQLYGLPITDFPELDRTGQDLSGLARLYDLYEEFEAFHTDLQTKLWVALDLKECHATVKRMHAALAALPHTLRQWPAYTEMRNVLQNLILTLPLLTLLSTKAIRDRHWRELMNITGANFELDGLQFATLLSLNVLEHSNKIQELARRANGEAQLESVLKVIESEWSEQIFLFQLLTDVVVSDADASVGDDEENKVIILDTEASRRQMDMAEAAHSTMAAMVSSPFLGPHRGDLVSWKAKLYEISEFLRRWLDVQALWDRLSVIFTQNSAHLHAEMKDFAMSQRDYFKFTSAAGECQNILQFCYGQDSDVPKIAQLAALSYRFETCRRSLADFLNLKREEFPRFYFASDEMLVEALGSDLGSGVNDDRFQPTSLRFVFSNPPWLIQEEGHVYAIESEHGERLQLHETVALHGEATGRLSEILNQVDTLLGDQMGQAIEVCDSLAGMSPSWSLVEPAVFGFIVPSKSTTATQICSTFLRMLWTQVSKHAIESSKTYRHAFMDAKEVMDSLVGRLSVMTQREFFDSATSGSVCRLKKLQSLLTLAIHLRDGSEQLISSRCRDTTDFSWLQRCRVTVTDNCDIDVPDDPTFTATKPTVQLNLLNESLPYGYEYYGAGNQIIITPTTERHLALLMCSINVGSLGGGSLLESRAPCCGRTETVGALAQMAGRYMLRFDCNETMDFQALGRVLTGVFRANAWGCFAGFERFGTEIISEFARLAETITQAHTSVKTATPLQPHLFLLSSAVSPTMIALSNEVRSRYRLITFTVPSMRIILNAKCLTMGAFADSKRMAEKLTMLTDICHTQFGDRKWANFGLPTALRVIELASAQLKQQMRGKIRRRRSKGFTLSRSESMVLTQTVDEECTLALAFLAVHHGQLSSNDRFALMSLLCNGMNEQQVARITGNNSQWTIVDESEGYLLELADEVENHAKGSSLICTPEWRKKVIEIYRQSCIGNTVFLVGTPGTGKTTCMNALVAALGALDTGQTVHRIFRMNVGALSTDQLVGRNDGKKWTDGFLTAFIRKLGNSPKKSADQLDDHTWIVLDGATLPYASSFADVFKKGGSITLGNGDTVVIPPNTHLVFETVPRDFEALSGAMLLPTSYAVLFEDDVVGWNPIASSWLDSRRPLEAGVLRKLFNRYINDTVALLHAETESLVDIPLVGQIQTMTSLLTSLLQKSVDEGELLADTHVECIFLFSLAWGLGGNLKFHHRPILHKYLKGRSPQLVPQDEPTHTIFDYNITDSADWLTWESQARVAALEVEPGATSGFVHTATTKCLHVLMELASLGGRHILLAGNAGSGKSSTIEQFMRTKASLVNVKRFVCSRGTVPASLRNFMIRNTSQRNGNVYGADGGKAMLVTFHGIDLLSAPQTTHGAEVERPSEILRLLSEEGEWFLDDSSAGTWCWIGDASLIGSLEVNEQSQKTAERLLRHFAVFSVPPQKLENAEQILRSRLHRNLSLHTTVPNVTDATLDALAAASMAVLEVVKNHFVSAHDDTWCNRFTMDDMYAVAHAMARIPVTSLDDYTITAYWVHECLRILTDRCSSYGDVEWIREKVYEAVVDKVPLCVRQPAGKQTFMQKVEAHLSKMHLNLRDLVRACAASPSADSITFAELLPGLKALGIHCTDEDAKKLELELEANGDPITLASFRNALDLDGGAPPSAQRELNFQDHSQVPIVVDLIGNEDLKITTMTPELQNNEEPGLSHLGSLSIVMLQAQSYLEAFNAHVLEHGVGKPLTLSRSLTKHLMHLTRVLNIPGCNAVCAGARSLVTATVVRFASYIAGYETVSIGSDMTTFSGNMRAIFRLAGVKNMQVTAILQGDECSSDVLDRVNSYLTCGEIYDLFSTDELNALFEGLYATMKDEGVTSSPYDFFISRVRNNVHLVVTFREIDASLQDLSLNYPALLTKCYMNRIEEQTSSYLVMEQAVAFFRQNSAVFAAMAPDVRQAVCDMTATVHDSVVEMLPGKRHAAEMDKFLLCFRELMRHKQSAQESEAATLVAAITACEAVIADIATTESGLTQNASEIDAAEQRVQDKLSQIVQFAADAAAAEDEGVEVKDDEELLAAFVAEDGFVRTPPAEQLTLQSQLHRERLVAAFDAATKWQAKITVRRTDVLRSLKTPHPLVCKVLDMVCIVLHGHVNASAFVSREDSAFKDSWTVTQVVVASPNFTNSIASHSPWNVDQETLELLEPYLAMVDLNADAVRFAAKEAAVFFEWILGIVVYARLRFSPALEDVTPKGAAVVTDADFQLKPPRTADSANDGTSHVSMDAANAPESGKSGGNAPAAAEGDVHPPFAPSAASDQLLPLQHDFDDIVKEKQYLEDNRAHMQERLGSAMKLDESLRNDIAEWKAQLSRIGCGEKANPHLVSNCVVVAAYAAYAGPMHDSQRVAFRRVLVNAARKYRQACQANAPAPDPALDCSAADSPPEATDEHIANLVFADASLPIDSFLDGLIPGQAYTTDTNGAESQALLINPDQHCILQLQPKCGAWPMVIDPVGTVEEWFKSNGATVLHYSTDSTTLVADMSHCLVTGKQVLISHVDPDALWQDKRLANLLMQRMHFNSRHVRSVMLGDEQVELHDDFLFSLSTTKATVDPPGDFIPYITVIDATPAVGNLEQSILLTCADVANRVLADDLLLQRRAVVECISSKAQLTSELLDSIKAAGTLKQDGLTAWVETVTAVKALVVGADSALNTANSKLRQLWRSSRALAPYSKTAAIIFQMVLLLPRLNDRYLCFDLCLQSYRDTVLSEQSVASINVDYGPVLKGFIRQIYQRVAPRLLEMDRQVFLFMLGVALGLYQNEEEKVEGGTKRFKSDRSTFESIAEFLSMPVPSLYTDALDSFFKQATLSAEQQQRKANSFELNLGKRFPAMLEGGTRPPWHEICHDNFDAILRFRVDWNLWRDNKRNANRNLPHDYDSKLRPLNRMAVTSTLNPHLFLGAADDMVRALVGPCVSSLDMPFNLGKELQESQLRTVTLLEGMCAADSVAAIGTLAQQEGVQMTVLSVHQSEAASEFEKALERALVLGSWFVVTGAHQNSAEIAKLRQFIETHASRAHPQFRFWVTASQAKSVCTPPDVLYELAFQPEHMRFKTNLLRTLTMLSDEVLNTSQRSEWLALLHNVCFLHCVLVGRRKFGTVGANRHYSFCEQDRLDVLKFAVNEYTHNEGSRVGSVRSFFSLVYGRHISHKQDRTALMALINSWLCTASTKPGFEFKFDLPVPVYAQPTFYSVPPTLFRKSDSRWTTQPPRHLEMRETLRYLENYPGLTEDRLAETCALNSWLRRDVTEDRHFVKGVRSLFSVMKPAVPSATGKVGAHSTMREPFAPLVTSGASSTGDSRTASLLERLDTLLKRVPAKVPRRVAVAQGTLAGKQHSVHIHTLEDPIWRFVEAEVSQLNELLRSVRQDVADMKEALLGNMAITPVMFASMQQILKKRVPNVWLAQSWVPTHLIGDVLGHWTDELEMRVKELAHLGHLGVKTPSIFLGGLFNPRGLLMAMCQREITAAHPKPTLRCEITVRDKDHLREPPADGIFIHNVALEGCGWDMTSQASGVKDIITLDKTTLKRTVLPVLHLTYAPLPEVPLGRGASKAEVPASLKKRPGEATVTNFSCPVYTTARRSQTDEDALIFNIDVPCDDSHLAMKWVSRGICATLR